MVLSPSIYFAFLMPGDTPPNTVTLSGAKLVIVWDSEVVDLDSSDNEANYDGFWGH
jgi:hypothetical protein